jgi:hypothetical protein
MTAVMFFAGAWGYLQLLKLPVPPGPVAALPAGGGSLLSNSGALLALAALAGTAVLAGVIAFVRWISPLASGLTGLLLLAWTALYLTSVRSAVSFIPLRSDSFGAGWEALLFNGILGAVGAVMIFPLFIPSRWRGPRKAVAEPDPFPRDAGDYLAADYLTAAEPDPGPQERQRQERPLVGTVLTRPSEVRPVDTTRITGASRALRKTGAFRVTAADPSPFGLHYPAADD